MEAGTISKKAISEGNLKEAHHVPKLLDYFRYFENQPSIFMAKTGFDVLDNYLGGGFIPGLTILGGVTAIGKTTFCLQLADQMSFYGKDVLFFSLEMSKLELIAKSLSRMSYVLSKEEEFNEKLAKVSFEILNNRLHESWDKEEKEHFKKIIDEYEKLSKNLYIYEGRIGDRELNVYDIKNIIEGHIKKTGEKPVVFIDYLQKIAAPYEKNYSDKQLVDMNTFILKGISRDFDIPIIAIASFNRDSYSEPVNLTSFKESGGIEYTADLAIGLQFSGMDYIPGEREKDRAERLFKDKQRFESNKADRKGIPIEVKFLKYRLNYANKFSFVMEPAYNLFLPKFDACKFRPEYENLFSEFL